MKKIVFGILFVIFVIGGGYWLTRQSNPLSSPEVATQKIDVFEEQPAEGIEAMQQTSAVGQSESTFFVIPKNDAFIDYIPHLAEADTRGYIYGSMGAMDVLPRLEFVEAEYQIGNYTILAGPHKILIYDLQKKRIILQNNPDFVRCVSSSALYKETLFVMCNEDTYYSQKAGYSIEPNHGKLYKISLRTGEFEAINAHDELDLYTNWVTGSQLFVYKDDLWIGVFGIGLVRWNQVTNASDFYPDHTYNKFVYGLTGEFDETPVRHRGNFYREADLMYMYEADGKMRVLLSFPLFSYAGERLSFNAFGVSEYDSSGKWNFTTLTKEEFLDLSDGIIKGLKAPSIASPKFGFLSRVVGDNIRYVLAEEGVYLLPARGLPTLVSRPSAPLTESADLFVNLKGTVGLLFFEKLQPVVKGDRKQHRLKLDADGVVVGTIDIVGQFINFETGTISAELTFDENLTEADKWSLVGQLRSVEPEIIQDIDGWRVEALGSSEFAKIYENPARIVFNLEKTSI